MRQRNVQKSRPHHPYFYDQELVPRSPLSNDVPENRARQQNRSKSAVIRFPGAKRLSDEALVRAVAEADRRVMDQLYDRLYPTVDRTLSRILGRRDEGYEDLIQVVFERVTWNIVRGRFDGRSRLTTWASAIASHVGVDEIRTRQRHRKFFIESPHELPEIPEGIEDREEQRLEARSSFVLVRQALARLSNTYAHLLTLYHLEGLSISELAAVEGLGKEACKSRLARARRKFVRELENLQRGDEP